MNRILSSVLTLGAISSLVTLTPSIVRAESPIGLKERQTKVQEVARRVMPAVVCLTPDRTDSKRVANGSGSGVIINETGLVLTAAHVLEAVSPSSETLTIILADGNYVQAKPLGLNRATDAALCQIIDEGRYPSVEMEDPAKCTAGEWAIAFGHHGGFEVDRTPPLRLGRLIDLENENFMISDCTLSGGDSGGPLFNLSGKLIGIHSSISWSTAVNRHVPMKAFKEDWDRLNNGKRWGRLNLSGARRGPQRPESEETEPDLAPENVKPDQPRLGVVVSPNDDGDAALIREVGDATPAAKAGLKVGDEIVKVNETDITSAEELTKKISSFKPGDKVIVTIRRDGEKQKIEVTLKAHKDL